ncbi:hypothetical protein [Povalibacter sp.]|uniref:hypothetical protein n=1 Tax=Povalibacter sp. TaxID=1962978 RepID=UPI002F40099B
MSRLRQLNDLITSIASEAKAIETVKSVLPNSREMTDNPGYGEPGVRNCAIIAEFVITFLKRGNVNYRQLVNSNTKMAAPKKSGNFDLKSYIKGDTTALLCEFGGHNAAILQEGNAYGLYQADDGVFHVFPRLNDDGESHNIFGTGDDTVSLINKEVERLQSEYDGYAVKVTLVP